VSQQTEPSAPPPYADLASDDPAPPRATAREVVGDAVAVLVPMLLVAVLGAVVWSAVVHPAQVTRLPNGDAMGELELSKVFATDGWFVAIGAVAGLVAGLLMVLWRNRDLLWTLLLVAGGSVLAALLMAWAGHHLFGPGDPTAALRHARVGATAPTELVVHAKLAFLAWPVGALVGALVGLVSRTD
jgi:hypothetical protein